MKFRIFIAVAGLMLAFNALGGKPHLSRIGEGYSATSVNTAVFRANSLATHGDTQYASYYDPEGVSYPCVAQARH